MLRIWKTTFVASALLALSACAHKDLTAPCNAGSEGIFGLSWPSSSAFACEPMRPVDGGGRIGGH